MCCCCCCCYRPCCCCCLRRRMRMKGSARGSGTDLARSIQRGTMAAAVADWCCWHCSSRSCYCCCHCHCHHRQLLCPSLGRSCWPKLHLGHHLQSLEQQHQHQQEQTAAYPAYPCATIYLRAIRAAHQPEPKLLLAHAFKLTESPLRNDFIAGSLNGRLLQLLQPLPR